MSNWAPKPKFMLAEGDTYMKVPSDETYPLLAINYLKLDKVPAYNESWAPVVEGIRSGNFFGTTGEILFHKWGIEGAGAKSVYTASIEYTFPLEFAELVWSDGAKVDRKIIRLTDTEPFGTKTFRIPFDATRQEVGALRRVGRSGRRRVAATGDAKMTRDAQAAGARIAVDWFQDSATFFRSWRCPRLFPTPNGLWSRIA